MNFAQLRAFHAVVQHRTFSAAAAALGVSQSAVTQHIRAFEETIGGKLFHRRGNGVELTPDARDLLPDVRRIVKTLEDVEFRVNGGRALRVGHLTVGMCAPHVAMPIIRRFRAAHSGVSIETRLDNSSNLLTQLLRHEIDLAIATLSAPKEGLLCHPLVSQEVLVLVPADHPWAASDSVGIGELEGQPFVLRESGSTTRLLFEKILAEARVSIGFQLALSSREAVKEAVAEGVGFGIVLDKELGCDTRIAGLRIEGARAAACEYLVANPEISTLGAVREFIVSARECYTETILHAKLA